MGAFNRVYEFVYGFSARNNQNIIKEVIRALGTDYRPLRDSSKRDVLIERIIFDIKEKYKKSVSSGIIKSSIKSGVVSFLTAQISALPELKAAARAHYMHDPKIHVKQLEVIDQTYDQMKREMVRLIDIWCVIIARQF